MKARSLWFRTQLRRNSNATKMQPRAAHVFIRCHTRGEEHILPSQESRGVESVGGLTLRFLHESVGRASSEVLLFFCTMLESKRKSSQGRLVTIPHSIHNMLATRIAGRTGYLALQ